MSSATVRSLGDVRMADAAEVGGKAASLGEVLAAGGRVPDGVVLTAAAADLAADERRSLLQTAARSLGAGPFAVRSSGISEDGAERSYAGIYETVLDVSVDELPAATDKVLASGRSARAAEYEAAAEGRLAVIVQRMVRPAAAGVALTADPITGDRRSCIVTGVKGSGDRLVSGAALGDECVVGDKSVQGRRRPERAIDHRQAARVARAARRISSLDSPSLVRRSTQFLVLESKLILTRTIRHSAFGIRTAHLKLKIGRGDDLGIQYGVSGLDTCAPEHSSSVTVSGQPGLLRVSADPDGASRKWVELIWPATIKHPNGVFGLFGSLSPRTVLTIAQSMPPVSTPPVLTSRSC